MSTRKPRMILGIENAKTSRGETLGYLTGILYLSPSDLSGYDVCPGATPGCISDCLNTAGRGAMKSVQDARLNKTLMFFQDRHYFTECLIYSIRTIISRARSKGMIPCIRLNGTSDLPWESIVLRHGKTILELFPEVQFYDYTAVLNRKAIKSKIANYHLTFSRKETRENWLECEQALSLGINVAAVYSNPEKACQSLGAINGDLHDLRFLDGNSERGKIIALKPKGKARKDTSGFVIHN